MRTHTVHVLHIDGSTLLHTCPRCDQRAPVVLKRSYVSTHGAARNVVSFEIVGGIKAGQAFLNKIKLCSLSANLGDSRTIVTHPSSTTHSKLTKEERLVSGITDGMVRISVGLEHVDDINQTLG